MNKKVTVQLIAACDDEYGIGRGNKLLYEFPDDLQRFKKLTTDSVLLMGRNTFESLPRILPGRFHVVLSRRGESEFLKIPQYLKATPDERKQVALAESYMLGLKQAALICEKRGVNKISIIGGGKVYREALSYSNGVDEIWLTRIWDTEAADAWFPIDKVVGNSRYFLAGAEHKIADLGTVLVFEHYLNRESVQEKIPKYVFPMDTRDFVLVRTETHDHRIAKDKIDHYHPSRLGPTLSIHLTGGNEITVRYLDETSRDQALMELDLALSRQ